MAKTKITPDTEVVDEAQPSGAIVPSGSNSPAPYEAGDQYEDSSRDIRLPVLGLVNKVGPLADKFENKAGNFVVGDLLIGPEVRVIPVAIQKLYSEVVRAGKKLEFGKEQSKIWSSEGEAKAAGYVVDKSFNAVNRCEEIARINYLVIQPAGVQSDDFFLTIGTLKVQPAVCTYRSGAFRDVYLPIFNHAARICMVKGIATARVAPHDVFAQAKAWTHIWTLKSVKKSNQQNTWLAPIIVKGEAVPAEVSAWIESNAGIVG